MKKKIIRVTTLSVSMRGLLRGQLRFMSNYYDILGVGSRGENNEIENLSKDEGISVFPIEMTRKITPIKDIIAVWKLYKLFKKEKPFIVHSHTPKAGTLSMLAAKLAKVPNRLHTIAGLPLVEAKGFKRMVLNLVEKITYWCATKIYPNSYSLADFILESKFTSQRKIKVIANGSSNGIDISYFDPALFEDKYKIEILKKELNITNTDFVFVFAGRLVKDKGINELVSAFKKINDKFPNTKLLMLGFYENELDPLLPKTVEEINTNSNIIHTGWVNDIRPYLKISNALVFPSYREGFPNIVMQAGAMGLPAIVTDINGCNEIIIEGENGTIIPVKNDIVLYKKMVEFLTNKSKYSNDKCRCLITSRYQQSHVWNCLLEEYNKL
ncbi:glycosyltransferase family 4 protein [Tamlana sp. 2201CG12-4]|uniref:glycosyltransferase family 4 protein n=1 Tax=Tamlana sp. 2201CG12-4 TaxID=3112582 RepID=UPI002DBF9EF5|nr:glycosyltransferase family 4 protein [Tamlana sp. 2201CG12-4]MEC3908026.1 glycosyltransferase family 4 protein [Tamlana sp. 2201CG12-4]